jgi:DNA-binding CsgD family transcriptional regulator
MACGVTKRDAQVLARIGDGCSTATVAEVLGVSTTTVRNHLQSIVRKNGAHRRTEAVVALPRHSRGIEGGLNREPLSRRDSILASTSTGPCAGGTKAARRG